MVHTYTCAAWTRHVQVASLASATPGVAYARFARSLIGHGDIGFVFLASLASATPGVAVSLLSHGHGGVRPIPCIYPPHSLPPSIPTYVPRGSARSCHILKLPILSVHCTYRLLTLARVYLQAMHCSQAMHARYYVGFILSLSTV